MQEIDFWKGITILLRNFHALNKKIFSCSFDTCFRFKEVTERLRVELRESNSKNVLESCGGTELLFEEAIECLQEKSTGGLAFIFKLLMKNGKESIDGEAFLGEFLETSFT